MTLQLGRTLSEQLPASYPAADQYSSLVSDNSASCLVEQFTWSIFLLLVTMAGMSLVGFVVAFVYFSDGVLRAVSVRLLRTGHWVPLHGRHRGGTSTTDHLLWGDSHDDRQTLHLPWIFLVFTACITIVLIAYIHRATM